MQQILPWVHGRAGRVLALLALASIGCASVHGQALEPDQLFERISPSVWGLRTFDGDEKPLAQGSAVVIGPGRLVTNCHVLAKAKSFIVRRENVAFGGTLEFADVERDLCQIQVRNFSAPAVEVGVTSELKVGQRVYAVGNPRGLELTFSDGLISGLRRSDDSQSIERIQTTAPISPGSSGGGLFDGLGRLIGITTATRRDSQNLNFAMPGDWIREVPERARAALERHRATDVRADPGVTPVQRKGSHFVGQTFRYAALDRTTGLRKVLSLRVNRFDGDNIVFNGGQRVEDPTGRVLKSETRLLSELDALNGIGGWVHGNSARNGTWSVDTSASDQPSIRIDMQGRFVGDSRLTTPAGAFDTQVFRFVGYRHVQTSQGAQNQSSGLEVVVWFAPELMRVVKFTAKAPGRSSMLFVDEEVVLEHYDR